MKRKIGLLLSFLMVLLIVAACGAQSKPSESTTQESTAQGTDLNGKSLLVYCGAGMTKPFQEISDTFEKETGVKMQVIFANAGQIQSQINTGQEGDFFIAGSAEELQPIKEYVSAQKNLVKHIPVLAVVEGNPKGIQGIADLAKEDVAVVIGDPEATPIGKIANKVFADFGIADAVKIAATTTTAPQLATAIQQKEADATIVWKENTTGDGVEVVAEKDMEPYIKTIPAASLSFSKDKDAAAAFLEFLDTTEVKQIWETHGYEVIR